MILGFTGTRKGLTPAQRAALPSVLACLPERVLHGGAEGADEEFHKYLYSIVNNQYSALSLEIYPTASRAHLWSDDWSIDKCWAEVIVHPQMNPLDRNRLIVARCDALLACPAEPKEVIRSGTWMTIRAARKLGKPITLLFPDGSIQQENSCLTQP